MSRLPRLSAAAARRIAIAAQGLDRARPAKPTRAHVAREIARLGVLQIDAVNVVARAHYMPLFARLGGYDPALLDGHWFGRKRTCNIGAMRPRSCPMSFSPCCAGAWRLRARASRSAAARAS